MLVILSVVAKRVFALFELVSGDAPGLERLRLGNYLMYQLPYGFGNGIHHRFRLMVTSIVAMLSMLSVAVGEELVIAEGGKSNYAIVVAVDATMQDHYAARPPQGMRSPVQRVIIEIHYDAPRTLRPHVRPGETSLRPPRDKQQHASAINMPVLNTDRGP